MNKKYCGRSSSVEHQLPKLDRRVQFPSPAIIILGFSFLISALCGCATEPYIAPPLPPQQKITGVYHRVEKGQTLWQISRIYNVDLESIVDINHISASSHIENGQLIFIPSEEKPAPVKRYPSAETTFIWPIEGRVIATFGQNFRNMINKGINVRPINSMDVVASLSGRVAFCSENFGPFGKTIIIEHSNGFSTVYARNAQIMVKAGDSVQKGMVIAKAGSSGRDKDVYLHYEIRKGVIPQNPYYYLP